MITRTRLNVTFTHTLLSSYPCGKVSHYKAGCDMVARRSVFRVSLQSENVRGSVCR